ncbi:hypothetical protein QBC46DRAFT_381542 [Diplogelasinospora grovesii]|uniref:Uncharacterized protein n=1 Tax=Diplogelasinospora grovesii TaxID=303347 RepID=A0AAN6S6N0_9PEZI|nr:hypothetical protein QBC46DRAFT_381542 [Diplogelasinospora grovesii]
MERTISGRASMSSMSSDDAATRPNRRFSSPLVINSASRRQSLFSRPPAKENTSPNDAESRAQPRPASSAASLSDVKMASPNSTRIPRPTQQNPSHPRRPFTLTDAYRMVEEEEEAVQGSPSPAPRSWRSRRTPGDSRNLQRSWDLGSAEPQAQVRHDQKPLEPGREDRRRSLESPSARSQRSEASESDFDEKLRRHAQEQAATEGRAAHNSGLISESRPGARMGGAGKTMLRKPSRNSLDGHAPPRSVKPSGSTPKGSSGWLARRLADRRTERSITSGSAAQGPTDESKAGEAPNEDFARPEAGPTTRSATVPPDHRSPNKSFAWQADADFTAGDLQISSSPPVNLGRSNTKLDEIRALEAEVNQRFSESPKTRQRNTRIDEIRALEKEAALKFPDEPPEPDDDGDDMQAKAGDNDSRHLHSGPTSRPASRTNARADEFRAREIESLSRRALATARLDEIRERNADYRSRSTSPVISRKSSREVLRDSPLAGERLRRPERERKVIAQDIAEESEKPAVEEPAVDALATVRPPSKDGEADDNETHEVKTRDRRDGSRSSHGSSHTREDSRDLLRRLALVTSSPVTEQRVPKDDTKPVNRGRDGREAAGQKKVGGAKSDARPTVGFAGLRRDSSVESGSDKRSNTAHSESDPTERIEGEMKLFAPLENHSERGSLRAPSPGSDEAAADETPRPSKVDPLTQPTPRVTGAFVETPATVKIEKLEGEDSAGPTLAESAAVNSVPDNGQKSVGPKGPDPVVGGGPGIDVSMDSKAPLLSRGRRANLSPRKSRHALSAKGDRMSGRSSSVSAHRRSKSLPRTRLPLVNSAKPPTVRDDLREIQQTNQIEDSTLDDLGDLLEAHGRANRDLGRQQHKTKREDDAKDLLDREQELEAYDRMSRSLKTGLLGIRTAKQGIERLENEVSHADAKTSLPRETNDGKATACPACIRQPSSDAAITYVHLPVPRLWHRHPRFRFTTLGLLLSLLSLWFVAESAMCFFYCKPQYCYPGKPCNWSPEDPLWGYSVPIKLDQWATGGQGRALANRVAPEMADWLADMWDVATGTDITKVDTTSFSWGQKRQHRRRLMKKGLVRPFVEQPEDKAKFEAWRAARLARERDDSAREMGYDVDEDETIAGDEKLSR